MLLLLVLLAGGKVLTCEQQCIPILELSEPFGEQIDSIVTRYPNVQVRLFALQAPGENPANYFDKFPDPKNYIAEMQTPVNVWREQMAAIWNGPWSEDAQIRLRIFDKALVRCQEMCY